jgi:hypothetical protein
MVVAVAAQSAWVGMKGGFCAIKKKRNERAVGHPVLKAQEMSFTGVTVSEAWRKP